MKRRLTLIAVVAGLAVLSLATVAAASAHGFGGSSKQLDRVAELLGTSPDELSSTMAQAKSEAKAERLELRLTAAVTDGVLTQVEADAIRDWFGGKPEALSNLSHSERHGLRGAVQNDTLTDFLAGLMTEEIITQADSDEIAAWFNVRPAEALEKFRPQFGHGGPFGRGGHFRHGRGGFGHGFRGFGGGFPKFGEPAPSTESGEATGTSIVYY